MWPILCVLCLIKGKPIPAKGTPLERIEIAALTIYEGTPMCQSHWEAFQARGYSKLLP